MVKTAKKDTKKAASHIKIKRDKNIYARILNFWPLILTGVILLLISIYRAISNRVEPNHTGYTVDDGSFNVWILLLPLGIFLVFWLVFYKLLNFDIRKYHNFLQLFLSFILAAVVFIILGYWALNYSLSKLTF